MIPRTRATALAWLTAWAIVGFGPLVLLRVYPPAFEPYVQFGWVPFVIGTAAVMRRGRHDSIPDLITRLVWSAIGYLVATITALVAAGLVLGPAMDVDAPAGFGLLLVVVAAIHGATMWALGLLASPAIARIDRGAGSFGIRRVEAEGPPGNTDRP